MNTTGKGPSKVDEIPLKNKNNKTSKKKNTNKRKQQANVFPKWITMVQQSCERGEVDINQPWLVCTSYSSSWKTCSSLLFIRLVFGISVKYYYSIFHVYLSWALGLSWFNSFGIILISVVGSVAVVICSCRYLSLEQ